MCFASVYVDQAKTTQENLVVNIKKLITSAVTLLALAIPFAASADPIIVVMSGGTGMNPMGGYAMTDFAPVAGFPEGGGCTVQRYDSSTHTYYDSNTGATSAPSPIAGVVQFVDYSQNPLCMDVQNPDWWQYDHGNVYTTGVNWVELIMPDDTRAFSFYVGGNFTGSGWVEGIDAAGNTVFQDFGYGSDPYIGFGNGTTPGFGVYAENSCMEITRIIIEPFQWGTGNFAINQDSCNQVPEPAPLALLAIGLLGLGLTRKLGKKGVHSE